MSLRYRRRHGRKRLRKKHALTSCLTQGRYHSLFTHDAHHRFPVIYSSCSTSRPSMAESKKSDAPSSTILLRYPTSPSWKPTLRRSLRTVLTIFSYTPLAFLLSRLAYLISPSLGSNSRSLSNNLHFRFADLASPLATLERYPVGITAGVLPKRIHAHNDCA
jgi:hypothetical protein